MFAANIAEELSAKARNAIRRKRQKEVGDKYQCIFDEIQRAIYAGECHASVSIRAEDAIDSVWLLNSLGYTVRETKLNSCRTLVEIWWA